MKHRVRYTVDGICAICVTISDRFYRLIVALSLGQDAHCPAPAAWAAVMSASTYRAMTVKLAYFSGVSDCVPRGLK